MFTLAARRLGYRVHVLTDVVSSPAGQVADVEMHADYRDLRVVEEFARSVDVVTLEFENVPAATAEVVERHAPVRPGPHVLHTTQHRIREKTFLRSAGLPVPEFAPVRSAGELRDALARIGVPAVLKTAEAGYDGKGQAILRAESEALPAWEGFGRRESIVERFVAFEGEMSVVAVRTSAGEFAAYGPIETMHAKHVLDVAASPAPVPAAIAARAIDIARTVMDALEVVGVLCVELFRAPGGELLVNELAPRPHNSGHLTIDAHATSQFEQQVRAACGLPLGSTLQRAPAAMANLLGDLWAHGEPDWTRVLALSDVHLHLYGKSEARPGRKMGHLTVLAPTVEEARERALEARSLLLR
jgi:5-(carboxyamino)imidazole ribonucleotide synthase